MNYCNPARSPFDGRKGVWGFPRDPALFSTLPTFDVEGVPKAAFLFPAPTLAPLLVRLCGDAAKSSSL